ADLFRTSFSLVECDLLQSRGRARRFLSWQEQLSPNSKSARPATSRSSARGRFPAKSSARGAVAPDFSTKKPVISGLFFGTKFLPIIFDHFFHCPVGTSRDPKSCDGFNN